MKRIFFLFLSWVTLLSLLVMSQAAFADDGGSDLDEIRRIEKTTETKSLPSKKILRKSASYSDPLIRSKVLKIKKRRLKDTFFRLGLSAGLTSIQSSDPIVQTQRQDDKLNSGLIFGLNGDFRSGYFGAELDSYFGMVPTKNIVETDDAGNETATFKKSEKQLGALISIKGQVPFYTSRVRWEPKLGVGFGYLTYKDKIEGVVLQERSYKLKGPFLQAGLEIEPFSFMYFGGDYATSISASGDDELTGGLTLSSTTQNTKFERIRFGTFFRIFQDAILGLQFVHRKVTFASPINFVSESVSESRNQFMASFMLEL